MRDRKPKAADIPDDQFLSTVLDVYEEHDMWTCLWDLEERIPGFPWKVLLAKARALLRRGLIRGCGCGCRGDFELTSDGMSYLHDRLGVSAGRLKRYSRARAIPWDRGLSPSEGEG